ncbi:cytochrome P450 [Obba rivulosa]|uniref:Cytochrome P450 n=1 Tax=Obba rivulosa TaxID=1052685 RepID=A0A8E2DGC7_9APHY|nr:cytochrome P450 [Obba rivulosa]
MALTLSTLALSVLVAAAFIGIHKLIQILLRPITSPLRYVPGPPNSSLLYGNSRDLARVGFSDMVLAWFQAYGHVFRYRVFLNNEHLVTTDSRALHHILTQPDIFGKSGRVSPLLGKGLLAAEGEQHRNQRHVMNPAFGPAQIRELTSLFLEKSLQLRDVWMSQIEQQDDVAPINVADGLSKMTLDVIGLTGFNYEFDALNPNGKPNELNEAFSMIFGTGDGKGGRRTVLNLLELYIPRLRQILPRRRNKPVSNAHRIMRRIGAQLIEEKKREILEEAASHGPGAAPSRQDVRGRDLLSLLIKANMAKDVPEGQRMSDEDILAQVPTFLVAGHETTSTATTWCLFALTQAPAVQKKLREELLSVGTDMPTMDELNALPYLDAVVAETLRVHSPVPQTARVAKRDDVVPLDKPFMDSNGKMQDTIRVPKGTFAIIPIMAVNKSKAIWGEDADEFRPERWEKLPEGAANIPGVWGHILTFLGGPRACIGFRFSLVEMKALIFALVRAFEFTLAVPADDIIAKSVVVRRPYLRNDQKKGVQMPLIMKPVRL